MSTPPSTRAMSLRTLEPGILELTTRGSFTLADAQALVEATRRQPGEPPISVLAHVKESSGLSSEARAFLAKELKPGWIDLTVMVGASFAVRVASKGVFLATTLLRGGSGNPEPAGEDDPAGTEADVEASPTREPTQTPAPETSTPSPTATATAGSRSRRATAARPTRAAAA